MRPGMGGVRALADEREIADYEDRVLAEKRFQAWRRRKDTEAQQA